MWLSDIIEKFWLEIYILFFVCCCCFKYKKYFILFYTNVTYHKICVIIFIILSTILINNEEEKWTKIILAMITILFFFIHHRIKDLIEATGIMNAVLHKYLNYHSEYEKKPLGRTRLSIKYKGKIEDSYKNKDKTKVFDELEKIGEDLRNSAIKLVEKIIHHNELIELVYKIQLFHYNQYTAIKYKEEIKCLDAQISAYNNESYDLEKTFIESSIIKKEKLIKARIELLNSLQTELLFINLAGFASPKLKLCPSLFYELLKSF